jgi:hypothetical protein
MVNSCFATLCEYYSKLGFFGQPEKSSTFLVETMRLMVNTEKEKHKMFTTVMAWLTRLSQSTYQSQLESYISSRSPTSVAEVEYLERQYSKMNRGGLL